MTTPVSPTKVMFDYDIKLPTGDVLYFRTPEEIMAAAKVRRIWETSMQSVPPEPSPPMTTPVVDEKALDSDALYKAIAKCGSERCAIQAIQTYLRYAPQPDVQKVIREMEGLKHEDTVGFRQTNNAIDKCIALVREGFRVSEVGE